MAAVAVQSAEDVCRQSLGLDNNGHVPALKIVDAPDLCRSLTLVIPMDNLQATWVEYQQSPIILNEENTLFVVQPPFDEDAPPRFIMYLPRDDDNMMTYVKLSVVKDNKPFADQRRATWTVFSNKTDARLAEGPIVERTKSTLTIANMDTETNIMFAWPDKRIRLESRQASTFRTGIDGSPTLLGECLSGAPRVLGLRYGLSRGLSARLTYILNIHRLKNDDIPTYECALNRQFLIENNSDVTFAQVSNIVIASETYMHSDDGYRPRELETSMQVIRPMFKLQRTAMTILGGGKHYINETNTHTPQCHVVCTIDNIPSKFGQTENANVCLWLPTSFLFQNMPQPAATHVHIRQHALFFDDIIGTAPWFQNTEIKIFDAPWTCIPLNTTTQRMSVTCTKQTNSTRVGLHVTNYFQVPMLVAFATYPGHPELCNDITATKNAHLLPTQPWETSGRLPTHTVFIVDSGAIGSDFVATFPAIQ